MVGPMTLGQMEFLGVFNRDVQGSNPPSPTYNVSKKEDSGWDQILTISCAGEIKRHICNFF
jgi:hypothetical protein